MIILMEHGMIKYVLRQLLLLTVLHAPAHNLVKLLQLIRIAVKVVIVKVVEKLLIVLLQILSV